MFQLHLIFIVWCRTGSGAVCFTFVAMPPSTEVLKWQRFFLAAGIPGTIASKYSKSFAEQRVQLTMLDDLDKTTLIELGVTTVGDQIAILRHIREMNKTQAEPMDCSTSITRSKSTAQGNQRTSGAPDRDDIYHIHLPAGTTPKTRAILQKHNMLKSAGLLKRGSSGIRQSGKDIIPSTRRNGISRLSLSSGASYSSASSINATASAEVSSTTDEFYDRMGIRGLVSDQLDNTRKSTVKKVATVNASSTSLFERAITESAASRTVEPVFRVKIDDAEEKAFKSRVRAGDMVRQKFGGPIRKQIVRRTQFIKSGLRLRPKAVRIHDSIRPSVFDRLS